jgi:hypothetical protein
MAKKIILLLNLMIATLVSFSQHDSTRIDTNKINRYVVWFIPSAADNIYGIAIGPVGSEAICDRPYTKYSHGLNLQIIGQGIFQAFYIPKFDFNNFYKYENPDEGFKLNDTLYKRVVHNGIMISPFGSFSDQINGLSLSLWMSMGRKVNGLSFNLLWNLYGQINGVSLGIVNYSYITKGLQIGLVNRPKKLKGIQN